MGAQAKSLLATTLPIWWLRALTSRDRPSYSKLAYALWCDSIQALMQLVRALWCSGTRALMQLVRALWCSGTRALMQLVRALWCSGIRALVRLVLVLFLCGSLGSCLLTARIGGNNILVQQLLLAALLLLHALDAVLFQQGLDDLALFLTR